MPRPGMPTERRNLSLPAEGATALRETLQIMHEQMVSADPHTFADVVVRLEEVWPEEETYREPGRQPGAESGDEQRDLPLTIAEADLLLDGLRFTEAASVDLPWYPMVVFTVQFVGDALLGLFTDDEWLDWRARVG